MARKDGSIKHTAVAEDGTKFTRMSPRVYTHAVLARVTAQRVSWAEGENAPDGVRFGKVIEKAGSYTHSDGTVSIWPTRFAGIVDITPVWAVLSWHQGPANAMKGHQAALKTREQNYGVQPFTGKVKQRRHFNSYIPTHCGTWSSVTLVEVARG